jgi:hypothetical protein
VATIIPEEMFSSSFMTNDKRWSKISVRKLLLTNTGLIREALQKSLQEAL